MLFQSLKTRFAKNLHRHQGHTWEKVRAKLDGSPTALESLREMESTGGEPDVIGYDEVARQYIFCDCSAESPTGRRSLCYDREALSSRKEHKPEGSAIEAAAAMGIEVLNEQQYRGLQQLGDFDTKTSSWVATPEEVRALGGALFCDRRFGSGIHLSQWGAVLLCRKGLPRPPSRVSWRWSQRCRQILLGARNPSLEGAVKVWPPNPGSERPAASSAAPASELRCWTVVLRIFPALEVWLTSARTWLTA